MFMSSGCQNCEYSRGGWRGHIFQEGAERSPREGSAPFAPSFEAVLFSISLPLYKVVSSDPIPVSNIRRGVQCSVSTSIAVGDGISAILDLSLTSSVLFVVALSFVICLSVLSVYFKLLVKFGQNLQQQTHVREWAARDSNRPSGPCAGGYYLLEVRENALGLQFIADKAEVAGKFFGQKNLSTVVTYGEDLWWSKLVVFPQK